MVLLAGGVWIAMTLAICGWVGQAFFTTTPPGKNLFSVVLGIERLVGARGAAALHLDGRDPVPHAGCREDMFEGLAPWLQPHSRPADAHDHPRLRHLRLGLGLVGGDLRDDRQGRAARARCGAATTRTIALGSLATAGTLGILIPPSITMVVYAVAADASIIRIFLAGFLPGFLLMGLFSGYIIWWALRHPGKTPPADPPMSFADEDPQVGQPDSRAAPLIVFIVWVLIAGYATATECAAYGVVGSLAIAAWSSGRSPGRPSGRA